MTTDPRSRTRWFALQGVISIQQWATPTRGLARSASPKPTALKNGVPAVDPRKAEVAIETGRLVMDLLEKDIRPRRIITKRSLQNAIAGVMATGGSTNAVLHLLAVPREAGVRLSIDDFDRIGRRTPLLADLKPWGRFTAPEMHEAGGMPLVARRLLEAGLLNEKELTVTGRTIGEEARRAKEKPGQEVIRPIDRPLKGYGGIAILREDEVPVGRHGEVRALRLFSIPGRGHRVDA